MPKNKGGGGGKGGKGAEGGGDGGKQAKGGNAVKVTVTCSQQETSEKLSLELTIQMKVKKMCQVPLPTCNNYLLCHL